MQGSSLLPMSSPRPGKPLQNEWQEEREGLYQMLDEKDEKIQKKSEWLEMLVKEVDRGRLVIGQQREKLKTLHMTIQESKVSEPS